MKWCWCGGLYSSSQTAKTSEIKKSKLATNQCYVFSNTDVPVGFQEKTPKSPKAQTGQTLFVY